LRRHFKRAPENDCRHSSTGWRRRIHWVICAATQTYRHPANWASRLRRNFVEMHRISVLPKIPRMFWKYKVISCQMAKEFRPQNLAAALYDFFCRPCWFLSLQRVKEHQNVLSSLLLFNLSNTRK
jgi:hypothetical protein